MADQKTTMAHTPGPWRVESGTTLVWGNCNPDDHSTYGMGYPVAECRINPSGNWSTGPYADEGEANAHLIAAAPDMEVSLRELLEELDHEIEQRQHGGNDEDWADLKAKSDRGHAALAKTGGKTK